MSRRQVAEESEAGGDAEGGERVGEDVVGMQPGGAEGEAAAEMSGEGVLDAEAEQGEGVEDAAEGGEGRGRLGHWVDFTLAAEGGGNGKGRSRFPEGMTERTKGNGAKAKARANADAKHGRVKRSGGV